MTAPLTDEQLDQLEESWRVGRPLPGAVRLVLAELRRLRDENGKFRKMLGSPSWNVGLVSEKGPPCGCRWCQGHLPTP